MRCVICIVLAAIGARFCGVAHAQPAPPRPEVSIEFKGAPVRDVLRTIARVSGRNVVIPEALAGLERQIDVSHSGVDFLLALQQSAAEAGLVIFEDEGRIYRVGSAPPEEQAEGVSRVLPPTPVAPTLDGIVPRVSLEFRRAEIVIVVGTIVRVSRKSFVAVGEFPELTNLVTLNLRNKAWHHAMDSTLRAVSLAWTENERGIVVVHPVGFEPSGHDVWPEGRPSFDDDSSGSTVDLQQDPPETRAVRRPPRRRPGRGPGGGAPPSQEPSETPPWVIPTVRETLIVIGAQSGFSIATDGELPALDAPCHLNASNVSWPDLVEAIARTCALEARLDPAASILHLRQAPLIEGGSGSDSSVPGSPPPEPTPPAHAGSTTEATSAPAAPPDVPPAPDTEQRARRRSGILLLAVVLVACAIVGLFASSRRRSQHAD